MSSMSETPPQPGQIRLVNISISRYSIVESNLLLPHPSDIGPASVSAVPTPSALN